MTYNLNKPMEWEMFKRLSVEMQTEYLNKLINEHGGNQSRIFKMFKVHATTLTSYIKERGIAVNFSCTRMPNDVTKARNEAWARFLNGGIAPEESEPTEAEPDAAPDVTPDVMIHTAPLTLNDAERKAPMSFDSFTLRFSGPFDPDSIRNSLSTILQRGEWVTLEISCEIGAD